MHTRAAAYLSGHRAAGDMLLSDQVSATASAWQEQDNTEEMMSPVPRMSRISAFSCSHVSFICRMCRLWKSCSAYAEGKLRQREAVEQSYQTLGLCNDSHEGRLALERQILLQHVSVQSRHCEGDDLDRGRALYCARQVASWLHLQ